MFAINYTLNSFDFNISTHYTHAEHFMRMKTNEQKCDAFDEALTQNPKYAITLAHGNFLLNIFPEKFTILLHISLPFS